MAGRPIRAITFDLWDTILVDDSDEPKRSAQGLAPKRVERRNLVEKFLGMNEPMPRELIDVAYDTADAAFWQVWYTQNITWTVRERLSVLLNGLGRQLPQAQLDELVRLHEDMELSPSPDVAPQLAKALEELHGKYRLGVVSDTIFSPGRVLRQLLARHDILRFFDSFVFSDEAGCAKPSAALFEAAAKDLSVTLGEIVHIGDRESKDIEGPHAVGARAILCTVSRDRSSQDTKADAICSDFKDLPAIVEKLNQR